MKNKLARILEKFKHLHLVVVGDLMLDRFVWGDVERISPEAPVPVVQVISESSRLGGAANVVNNIRSLGARVTACGIVGDDAAGNSILQQLVRIGASTTGVISDSQFQTIQKTRIIARPRHQQIVRLDREGQGVPRAATLAKLRDLVLRNSKKCDGIVISDYGKGVVHGELLKSLSALCKGRGLLCVVDPKKENYARYKFFSLITPNKDEASEASGIAVRDDASLLRAGRKLVRRWRAGAVLITRGADGMSLFRPRGRAQHFPTEPRDVFDVTGAGDTVVAVCALALACGAGFEDTVLMANLAAGIVGEEAGTTAVSLEKLSTSIGEFS